MASAASGRRAGPEACSVPSSSRWFTRPSEPEGPAGHDRHLDAPGSNPNPKVLVVDLSRLRRVGDRPSPRARSATSYASMPPTTARARGLVWPIRHLDASGCREDPKVRCDHLSHRDTSVPPDPKVRRSPRRRAASEARPDPKARLVIVVAASRQPTPADPKIRRGRRRVDALAATPAPKARCGHRPRPRPARNLARPKPRLVPLAPTLPAITPSPKVRCDHQPRLCCARSPPRVLDAVDPKALVAEPPRWLRRARKPDADRPHQRSKRPPGPEGLVWPPFTFRRSRNRAHPKVGSVAWRPGDSGVGRDPKVRPGAIVGATRPPAT